jgi:NAD(P)-dependent dehydrogenase (short-subunit alcohol dehydrogenase family)
MDRLNTGTHIMDINANTVAFITGGASGIGLSIAASLAKRGARIMLADLDAEKLQTAAQQISQHGAQVDTVICDVADLAQVQNAAKAAINRFGKVHIVANNAGVALGGMPGKIAPADWHWVVDINLMGVVHGAEVFTPILQSQGEGGHFINTASMAGHVASPGMGPYHATKFAVVGYSEGLKLELERFGIGVSVLCPAWVKTDIHKSALSKPSGAGSVDDPLFQSMTKVIEAGISPESVGEWTAQCVADNRFYIFTHPDFAEFIDARHARIKADYDACAAYPGFRKP